jgi:multisubunit Na+/H+ antiporter MnhF subunit
MLFAGMAAQSLHAGELLIALYALYVLVRRIASRTTFMLVLISLGTIVLLRAIGKDTQLITNFAVYSFLLSFVGVLALAREVRHPAK